MAQPSDGDDRELKARLEKLSGALEKIQKDTHADQVREIDAQTAGRDSGRAMSLAFRVVSELVAGILVGVGIGWALDKALSTSPAFMILFLLLGTAAGFWNVIRAAGVKPGSGKDSHGG